MKSSIVCVVHSSTADKSYSKRLRKWAGTQGCQRHHDSSTPSTAFQHSEVSHGGKDEKFKTLGHFVKLLWELCIIDIKGVNRYASQNTSKTSHFIEHVLWGLRFLHTNANIEAALCVSPMWACPKGLDNSLRELKHIKQWIDFIECPAWLCGHLLRDEAWTADNVSPYTCQTLTLDPQSATHGSCFTQCSRCVCNTTCCELTEEHWPQITTTWVD